jgi:hypothetical protein
MTDTARAIVVLDKSIYRKAAGAKPLDEKLKR